MAALDPDANHLLDVPGNCASLSGQSSNDSDRPGVWLSARGPRHTRDPILQSSVRSPCARAWPYSGAREVQLASQLLMVSWESQAGTRGVITQCPECIWFWNQTLTGRLIPTTWIYFRIRILKGGCGAGKTEGRVGCVCVCLHTRVPSQQTL